MAFINQSMNDVREPEAAPEDEYDLKCIKAERKPSAKGRDMIRVLIGFDDRDVNAPPFMHFVMAPADTDDPAQVQQRLLDIKRFCTVFDLDPENFDEQDIPGQTGRCPVVQEVGEDNVVRNKLKLPRLKD